MIYRIDLAPTTCVIAGFNTGSITAPWSEFSRDSPDRPRGSCLSTFESMRLELAPPNLKSPQRWRRRGGTRPPSKAPGARTESPRPEHDGIVDVSLRRRHHCRSAGSATHCATRRIVTRRDLRLRTAHDNDGGSGASWPGNEHWCGIGASYPDLAKSAPRE